ncbi:MAG TPA: hypothetical protein VFJ43_18250, partial [Bacteroidia bacterium]|nr:hypothetical protein [Bacteroidia bacterium]
VDKRIKAAGARSNFAVYITYKFEVDGKSFQGDKVFPVEFLKGQKGFLKNSAEKFINEIPAVTTIYFNPVNPQENIMFRGGAGFSLLLLFMGIFCLLYGLAYFAIACVPTH